MQIERGTATRSLREPGAVLLVACYELGRQPLSLAWPLACLRQAGFDPIAVDTSVDPLPAYLLRRARLIAIATPMHTALRLGVAVAERARALNPTAHRCAHGLYAGLNAEYLLGSGLFNSVISGEVEDELVALAEALGRGAAPAPPANPVRVRLTLPLPERATLPVLDRYAKLDWQGELRLVGSVEATRGCRHTCRHCPLTPVYNGRFFAVPVATVLADIRQVVAAGAQHITFGDPDFFNGPTHALRVTRAMHAEFPDLTFDATIKIEHLLNHRALLPELRSLGCLFVVSAVESLSDEVLRHLDKGHTRADVEAALAALDAANIALRPSLLPFTPWTTPADYLELLDFILAEGLEEHVDPVHLAIRLLLPPGSPLVTRPDAATWLGPLDAAGLSYTWRHPDPRLDELHAAVASLVEQAQQTGQDARSTIGDIRRLAESMLGGLAKPLSACARSARQRPTPPRLTESWFCCAEPTTAQVAPLRVAT